MLLVVESREKQATPSVVERWGEPESSKSIMAVSMIDRKSRPVRFEFVEFSLELKFT